MVGISHLNLYFFYSFICPFILITWPYQGKVFSGPHYPMFSSRTRLDLPVGGDIQTLKLFSVDMKNTEMFLCFVFVMRIIMGSHFGGQNLTGQLLLEQKKEYLIKIKI